MGGMIDNSFSNIQHSITIGKQSKAKLAFAGEINSNLFLVATDF